MKLILSQDVPNIGKKGEIKDVSDGFAMNFLLVAGKKKPTIKRAYQKFLNC